MRNTFQSFFQKLIQHGLEYFGLFYGSYRGMRDRSELRREMLKVDAGIDTEVEVICQGCGNRLKTRLEGEPNFLFPYLGSVTLG